MRGKLLLVSICLLFAACSPDRRHNGGTGDGGGSNATCDPACPMGTTCSMGVCKAPCDAALDTPSNVGCDFWAADLDNEATSLNNAASQQFAVVVANDNDYAVTVTVTENTARVGQPLSEHAVAGAMVPPHTATRVDLPQREVDGSMGQNGMYTLNSGTGTFVSPHAFHVVTTGPVVVYQFNPIIQQFSNDASTLIPIQALGADYVIIGFPTANPCAPIAVDNSIPDHTSITIVPAEDDTTITVTPSHPVLASGGDSGIAIPATAKNTPLVIPHVSRYTVVNLESDQPMQCDLSRDGDFTGSIVHADKPVAVFASNERGDGFGGADNVVYPPDWDMMSDDLCCTDHLEEQLLPVTALGKEFAIARSPIRSTDSTGWKEPDIVRVVATVDGTNVTTNLPAPNDHFVVGRNQQHTFAATTGFAMTSDQPIEVATYLVPQHFVKHGYIGDPSSLLMPAAEQFRQSYVYLVPGTFQSNYIVVAKPADANITLDGTPLGQVTGCSAGPIGMVNGTMFDQLTCPAMEGRHVISGDKPFGLSVYGYYNVGSYAFVGGSDVKIINPIE